MMRRFSGLFALLLMVLGVRPTFAAAGWAVVSSPNVTGASLSRLNGVVALSPTNIWAAGYSTVNTAQTLIEHDNGTGWSIVASPNVGTGNNSLNAVARVPGTNHLWAVGEYDFPSTRFTTTQALYEYYDGRVWSVIKSPIFAGDNRHLTGLTILAANNIWVVGWSNPHQTQMQHTFIEHWNGTNWSVVKSPNTSATTNGLLGIAAVSAHNIWAVGFGLGTLIEHYNGGRWSIIPNANSWPLTSVIALSATNVWAVGDQLALHYDGIIWKAAPLPVIPNTHIYLSGVAAVPHSSRLWAVGYTANGGDGTQVALSYDGITWSVSPLPASIGYHSFLMGVMALSDSDIWAVGVYYLQPAITVVEQNT